MFSYLPLFVKGEVVHGLGRGSKELGIPTANLDEKTIRELPEINDGVYAGVASVESYSGIFQAAISVGRNIHFGEINRTFEVHILHQFDPDLFYGKAVSVVLASHIREMMSFSSLELLIDQINQDIANVRKLITDDQIENFRPWFQSLVL